ncbi:MAG: pyrimidine/purine nucleoside phosphorylase [Patescibacteria group bacterium]|nr:pyrimidine/purine nucleoside phosphorylase [Patescibacteria group bacterium]
MARKKTDPGIKHNVYFKGRVQSLGFTSESGDHTVGVVSPGRYEFGIAKRQERIVVVYGCIKINGQECKAISTFIIPAGKEIVFEATRFAAYTCSYGE